jgi:hypothetical protein
MPEMTDKHFEQFVHLQIRPWIVQAFRRQLPGN